MDHLSDFPFPVSSRSDGGSGGGGGGGGGGVRITSHHSYPEKGRKSHGCETDMEKREAETTARLESGIYPVTRLLGY